MEGGKEGRKERKEKQGRDELLKMGSDSKRKREGKEEYIYLYLLSFLSPEGRSQKNQNTEVMRDSIAILC